MSAQISGFDRLAAGMSEMSVYLPPALKDAAESVARELVSRVKSNASGRPGPEIRTGAYVASIDIQERIRGEAGAEYIVGTNAPQAMRLEYGFRGTDSLGRTYDQPPYPHWGPAAEYVQQLFPQRANDAVARVVR